MKRKEKKDTFWKYLKVFTFTIVTLGVYGAYWAMSNTYEEDDIDADETQKNADHMQRAAAAAFLMSRNNRM